MATGLVAVAAVRDADWLVALCLLAALATWSLHLPPAVPWLLRPLAGLGTPERRATLLPAIRGSALALVLLAVFGGLFVTADAAFRDLVARVVPDLGALSGARLIVLVAAASIVGAAALVAAAPALSRTVPPYAGRLLRPVEWVLPLLVLDLLFAAFVTVQLTVLFGGARPRPVDRRTDLCGVRPAGLRAAGRGRGADPRRGRGHRPPHASIRSASSGAARGAVPTDAGGAGVGVGAARAVRAGVRLHPAAPVGRRGDRLARRGAAAGARRRAASPRRLAAEAVVLAAAGGLLLFAVSDPDARIAERNVERFAATGQLDLGYLAGLSADAVPALQSLPEPQRPCVLGAIGPPPTDGWTAVNLSRVRLGKPSPRARPVRARCRCGPIRTGRVAGRPLVRRPSR